MKIPVFISSPTSLSPSQEAARAVVIRQLEDNDLEPRALGRSDYPTELPLREVLLIARHCSGGIILGFEQFRAETGIIKPGTPDEKRVNIPTPFPTAWNIWNQASSLGCAFQFLSFVKTGFQAVFSITVFQMYLSIRFHRQTSKALQKMH
jgi:hypothetical protein